MELSPLLENKIKWEKDILFDTVNEHEHSYSKQLIEDFYLNSKANFLFCRKNWSIRTLLIYIFLKLLDSSNFYLVQNPNLFLAKKVKVVYKSKHEGGKKRLPVSNDFLFVFCHVIEVIHCQFGKAKLCVLLQLNCWPQEEGTKFGVTVFWLTLLP